jgi:hypothetical protein
VKIKLDENLHTDLVALFTDVGRDIDSEARLIITLDRGFGDIRRYPPGTHAGILVLRVDDQSLPGVRATVQTLVARLRPRRSQGQRRRVSRG